MTNIVKAPKQEEPKRLLPPRKPCGCGKKKKENIAPKYQNGQSDNNKSPRKSFL